MSIDVKDHRKYLEGKEAKENLQKSEVLLAQVASETANTGDPYFDKLIRTLEALIKGGDDAARDLACACAGAVQADMGRLKQMEYMYVRGKVDGYKEAALIPARILAEAKPANA